MKKMKVVALVGIGAAVGIVAANVVTHGTVFEAIKECAGDIKEKIIPTAASTVAETAATTAEAAADTAETIAEKIRDIAAEAAESM